ncbi:ATP-binding protein [Spirochaeta lutea]|uniref:ATP-binding protein n=1 Tax=Spirochaeta lutea TaxID=1480694 RepID=UPI00315ACA67
MLTGDIGSGKSTLADAITTLLVAPNRISYNKAAGAEHRERDLRSYVLGYYKSERSETGYAAKPVALRGRNNYSVILGVFYNQGYDQTVALAQVFHQRDSNGQPTRFYVVSDQSLSIQEHFSGFGSDLSQLRKNLRSLDRTEPIFDSFTGYGAAFRRRFGLQGEQAMELFHQTVSMKSVGNLTAFVRQHMLEAFDVGPRIEALITHFDDLNRAHQAVLRAKDQIGRLHPMVEKLDKHTVAGQNSEQWRGHREALALYFAGIKRDLLSQRIDRLTRQTQKEELKLQGLSEELDFSRGERDSVKLAISEKGGDRLAALGQEEGTLEQEKRRRLGRAEEYGGLCNHLELPKAQNPEGFLENRHQADVILAELDNQAASVGNRITELSVDLTGHRTTHGELTREIASLQGRKSNINSRQIAIRRQLCEALGLSEDELPFAGELIMVRQESRQWEGAAERLLHGFALSLLVPDGVYTQVAGWVDQTHLGGKLVYYRVISGVESDLSSVDPDSLINHLQVKQDSTMAAWVSSQLEQRFDYTCCHTMEDLRRASRGITRAGQIKGNQNRHEKDDRHALDDRSRYVLGWQNQSKIKTLQAQAQSLETRMQEIAADIAGLQTEKHRIEERRSQVYQLKGVTQFDDINWQPIAARLEQIRREIQALEQASNILQTLQTQLSRIEQIIRSQEKAVYDHRDGLARLRERLEVAQEMYQETCSVIGENIQTLEALNRELDPLRTQALGDHTLTVESCDNYQSKFRTWIQAKLDAEEQRLRTLEVQIASAMQDFRREYPAETRDLDTSLESAGEYRSMLEKLERDDLPRFENHFKELLNQNAIREIANFQAQLKKETQIISERVDRINQSMAAIEFNKDRYIQLETQPNADNEIRLFRQELKSCIEGSFTGTGDDQYSEEKFIQVKAIIDRFRGREGSTDLDRRWTEKVTDVRNWFSFAASERWIQDNTEYEHYTDSGGKSGGQKEKLAYTVLAASLAYQFGLEFGEIRSRSFRFVMIDEAFGRGSDESADYGLRLFRELNLQLLIITPLQKIHVIEPYVSTLGFVYNQDGRESQLRSLTIQEYRQELAEHRGAKP